MFKPKFYAKCKSSLKITKTRIELLKKNKGSVVRFLKSAIVELLRTGLDYNAYCRAEGLMIEQDRLSCYHLIDQFVECISSNLSAMQRQRSAWGNQKLTKIIGDVLRKYRHKTLETWEFPEECKEALASLIYAAARFSEFPELRDLRTLFTEKYRNSLEPFTSEELVEKLSSKAVTKEMKLQLLHDIALEFSIDWDGKSLEQKLYKPPSFKQESAYDSYNMETDDDACKQKKSREGIIQEDMTIDKVAHNQARKDVKKGGHNQQSSSDDESVCGRYLTDQDSQVTSSTSVDSCSEDEVGSKRPLFSKFIPPYFKAKAEREESLLAEEYSKPENNFAAVVEENNHRDDSVQEEKPKPRSVRRRNLKPPPGRENIDSTENNLASNTKLNRKKEKEPINEMDEEEKELDELLMQYTKKDSPGEPIEGKPYLKPPPSHYKNAEGSTRQRNTNLSVPPGRAASMPLEPTPPTESHARRNSLQPETLAGHVHPKLPDYDNLVAQMAALKGR